MATFNRSFRPVVSLKSADVCSLKRHFRGVLREAIGYLDKLAGNDPERFVWPTVPDIVRHCTKYSQSRAPYRQRIVEAALAFFRHLHVISGPVIRVRGGLPRRGFIVTPHDALYRRNKGHCEHCGQLGRWESSGPGGTVWPVTSGLPTDNPRVQPDAVNSAERSAVSSAASSAGNSAVFSAVQNPEQCGNQCGEQCGIEPPQVAEIVQDTVPAGKVFPQFCETSVAPSRGKSGYPENRQAVSSRVEPGLAGGGDHSAAETEKQNQPQKQNRSVLVSSSSQADLTDQNQTIGQHFAGAGGADIETITDGEFDQDVLENYANTALLENTCCVAAEMKAAAPFRGRATCAQLMDDVMRIMRGQAVEYPRGWLLVKKNLEKSPGPCTWTATRTAERKVAKEEQARRATLAAEIAAGEKMRFERIQIALDTPWANKTDCDHTGGAGLCDTCQRVRDGAMERIAKRKTAAETQATK